MVIGDRAGPYAILAKLGEGGMGEVYRARDTKLNRDVALKVLPDSFANDPDRLARFQREAQVLASLNHPNIAHIHGLEESGGVRALVMELVEGEDLAQRVTRGAIPIDEALPIAKQIAEALEAAHEQGIIHRDLKPANIKVTPDGTVKVLDFGLAKAMDPPAFTPNASQSPTITTPAMTQAGMILGTAAYMSPEQAKGRPSDKRSDVWAFGCVLYEMLTGKRAFVGEDVSETLAAVIRGEPGWADLPVGTPPTIRRLLRRCLEKDRRRRLDSAAAARLDIDDVLSGAAGAGDIATAALTPAPPSNTRLWLSIAGAVVTTGLVTGASVWMLRSPVPQPVIRLSAMHPDGTPVGDASNGPDVAITPDGMRIVYSVGTDPGTIQLFLRSFDQLDATPLKGMTRPRSPFISPDGQWVGYFDGNEIKKVAITGGPPVTICTQDTGGGQRGATWGADGTIVFAVGGQGAGLLKVDSRGGKPELLVKPDPSKGESTYLQPEWLPSGRGVLFSVRPARFTGDNGWIAVLELRTGRVKVLVQGGTNPQYVASGHLVYAAGGVLRAVPFDADHLEVRGSPVPIADHVATKQGGGAFPSASFAVAESGTLAYRRGEGQGLNPLRTLVWVDRHGHEEALGVPPRTYAYGRLSPDGAKLALDIRDQESDIWVWDLARHGPLTRLTFDPGVNRGGVWSPDGRRIAFSAERDGTENIYWQAADGAGTPERLTDRPNPQTPNSFTPDGRILFSEPSNTPFDVGMINFTGERRADLLLHGPQSENNPEVSPDGKWLAYESDESTQAEVYVRPFPNVDGGRWQVSNGGGTRPAWSRSGRELFYDVAVQGGSTAKIMAVPVNLGTTLTFGAPQVVVDGRYLTPQAGRTYDVSLDGKRFLMIKDATPASTSGPPPPPSQLVVVLNWMEELKARVPKK
jgi:serine/threonine protein kinase/Tol biopolymer transport system component